MGKRDCRRECYPCFLEGGGRVNIRNAKEYMETFLQIKTKDGEVRPFRLNKAQERLYDIIKREHEAGRPVRIVILKARQLGFSTVTQGMVFADAATRPNVRCLDVAHRDDATANLFRMSKLFLDGLPMQVRPMVRNSNAQEILFENPTRDPKEKMQNPGLRSSIRCVTAGGGGIGRSDTLTNVHASEYAFWPGDKKMTLSGILQAVPNIPGTMVIIESTANGFDDFKTIWDDAVAGRSDFVPVFFAWYDNEAYRMPVPPGTVWSPEERELQERYNLSEEQLAWRRWCIRNNCHGDVNVFNQEYPGCPEDAFISSGNPVFDNQSIIARLAHLPKPEAVGRFTYDYDGLSIRNIKFAEDAQGPVKIYAKPKDGYPYVLGGDTAGEGSDFFTGQMLDNTTGKQVAVLRGRMEEVDYAHQLYCMGIWYNTALLGVEMNYSSYPVRELERLGYPNIYVRQREDTFTHAITKSFGFVTNVQTRPLLVANLVTVMQESPECVIDEDTLREMLVFCYDSHRKATALPGEHDDLVMALGIAHHIRPQAPYTATAKTEKAQWSKSQWEDFYRASPEEQAYLLDKWGDPR